MKLRTHTKEFKQFLFIIFILSIANIPIALLLLRTQDLGLRASFIPLFYLFFSISYTAFSYSAGRLSDKVGDRPVILGGYLLIALAYVLMIYDHTLTALAIGFFILGVGNSFTDGIQRSFAARLTLESERGNAYGLLNSAIGIGLLVSGVGGGYIWEHYGAVQVLTLALGLILVALVCFGLIGAKRTR